MQKILVSLLTFLAFSLFFVAPVAADNSGYGVPCTTTYGNPCESKKIMINKMVQNPKDGNFVDNLGTNDPKFGPEQSVNFRITVTNTGNTLLSDVDVIDTLPSYVTFTSGAGNFDQATKKLRFHVKDLKAGESREFTITAKTVKASDLPKNQGITCVTNHVFAGANGMEATDNAAFCIQTQKTTKGGLPVFEAPNVTTTPATGAESLMFFTLIPSVLTGFMLRKSALGGSALGRKAGK